MTFLWEHIAFGPIRSRRLGNSLGINVLPTDVKLCSFDCLYCECGWSLTKAWQPENFYPLVEITQAIKAKIKDCHSKNVEIDSITFSGNGEPTLHPEFGAIVEHLIQIRNQYYPDTIITCLSNSTQLHRADVKRALLQIENPLLKLDAGSEEMFQRINRPNPPVSLAEVVEHLKDFKGKLGIQTLFFKGDFGDNTADREVCLWLEHLTLIRPEKVLIYSLDRATPELNLQKIPKEKLEQIADRVRQLNLNVFVY